MTAIHFDGVHMSSVHEWTPAAAQMTTPPWPQEVLELWCALPDFDVQSQSQL